MEETEPPLSTRSTRFMAVYALVATCVTLYEYSFALQDRSWGALGVAIYWGPAINGVFALIGVVATCFLPRVDRKYALGLSVGLPIVLSVLLFLGVILLDLHGG
jgi:peptidoglycan/LPS O-acetylase OafA/YrhL